MGLREAMANKPVIGIAIAAVILAVVVVRMRGASGYEPPGQWFYDLGSGQLYAYEGDELPPVAAPSGSEGVLAHVFACGDCADEAKRQAVYLEKWTEEGKSFSMTDAGSVTGPPRVPPDRKVAMVPAAGAQPQWFDSLSPQGRTVTGVVMQVREQCADTKAWQRCSAR